MFFMTRLICSKGTDGSRFLRRHRPAHGRDAKLPGAGRKQFEEEFYHGNDRIGGAGRGAGHGRLRGIRVQGAVRRPGDAGTRPDGGALVRRLSGADALPGLAAGGAVRRLFTDGLYQKLGKNAIETAERLREGFREKGFSFYLDTPTNQIFLVVDRAQREDLARKAAFSFWEQLDEERTVIRFVTSWATRMEDVEELIRRL